MNRKHEALNFSYQDIRFIYMVTKIQRFIFSVQTYTEVRNTHSGELRCPSVLSVLSFPCNVERNRTAKLADGDMGIYLRRSTHTF